MITSVTLSNFKNFRRELIDFERLTVLVGANGSGKTSVLDSINHLIRAVTPRGQRDSPIDIPPDPSRYFVKNRHCDWLYKRGGTGDFKISCTTTTGAFSVTATPPDSFPPKTFERFGFGRWKFSISPSEQVSLNKSLAPAKSLLYLHFNSTKLAQPYYSNKAIPCIKFDGRGLPAVLAYMALNDPDGFEALGSEMRQLVPTLKRIRFTKKTVHETEKEDVRFGNDVVTRDLHRTFQGDALLFDFDNANSVPADSISEGTLMILGLLTVIRGPASPSIILLDDIEHGLHPQAQWKILDSIRALMQQYPKLQIIATTHSPYLLDHLRPEEVRLTALTSEGDAVCGRLIDHPQFPKWKDEMASGELWSLFGERWLTEDGGPT